MQRITPRLVRPGPTGPRSWTKASTAVQLRARATNAGPVAPAGPGRLSMSHTPNISLINKIHEAWARANGYRPQAASIKRAGGPAGIKHQASKEKLDKSSGLGYCRITEDSKKRAPKRSPTGPLSPSPARLSAMTQFEKSGRSCESSSGHKGLKQIRDKSCKHQAPSYKPQA